MTLSSESTARVAPGRGARVLRGRAVEHAKPAALHIEHASAGESFRPRTPTERAEAARQEAYDEGYRAGLDAMRGTAEEARLEALRKGSEALRQAVAAIEAGRANAIAVVEEDAATLAVELTRTLVDHELSQADNEIAASIRRALRLTSPGEDLVVRLHPDEVIEASELQTYVTDCRVTVIPDESIEPGGCVIDAGPCRIDAQIETALSRVRWALLGGSRTSESSETVEPTPAPVLERTTGL